MAAENTLDLRSEVLNSLPDIKEAKQITEQAFKHGQEHLFADWQSWNIGNRTTLIEELSRVDWEVVAKAQEIISGADGGAREYSEDEILPKPMRTYDEQQEFAMEDYELGREYLIDGKAAWLIPAGGSGSRLVKVLPQIYDSLPFKRLYRAADNEMLQFDESCAKGQLPITPVFGRNFYGLFMEQALAIGARVGRMPLLMFMLSDTTREASLTTITNHPMYDSLKEAIVLFNHGMNPVLDDSGKIIPFDNDGHLVFSGNGNGGLFKALEKPYDGHASLLEYLDSKGIETVGFSNVDNPVADIILPKMLGSHLRLDKKLTFGVVKKTDPGERVGMIVQIAGQEHLDKIEYNEFPEKLAEKTNPEDSSRLMFEHGDVNVFLMDYDLMKSVKELPLKVYRNKSVQVQGGKKNGNKFESFTFHIIRQTASDNVDVKEILRKDQFMPTKNSVGRDSPATVIRAFCKRNMHWLQEQGAEVAKQGVEDSIRDLIKLIDEKVCIQAEDTAFTSEIEAIRNDLESTVPDNPVFDKAVEKLLTIGSRAATENLEGIQTAVDLTYSILRPGEAAAFVEFSPCLAMEKEDLEEVYLGEGWKLERNCQVALSGHPTKLETGSGFHVGENGAFILDIKNEYGEIRLNSDRFLSFGLEKAGSAQIGENVSIERDAQVEIAIEGDGRLEIPDNTVLSGKHKVIVKAGETKILP